MRIIDEICVMKKKSARGAALPYGAAIPSYNPYENRPRVEGAEAGTGFDAPAPVAYEGDPSVYAGGARPSPMAQRPQMQPYQPQYAPQYAPQQGQPYMPTYQPYAPQQGAYPQEQAAPQPAANEKDDLGVPAFLRRERK